MMNVLELQDKLKNFSEDQLVNEMQQPSGNVPQYLVLSEINRRKRVRDDYQQQQQGQQSNMTVAQEKLAAAGIPQEGLAGLAESMAPQTDMTMNTGATPDQTMPLPEAPAPMAEAQPDMAGGIASMAKGGYVRRLQVGGPPGGAAMSDPAVIAMANRAGMSVQQYLASISPEEAARVVADADQRAERSRMMALEPIASTESYLDATPTQEDLDRKYQEEQFAFDASRPMTPPAATDMPTLPSIEEQPSLASAAPSMPSIGGVRDFRPFVATDEELLDESLSDMTAAELLAASASGQGLSSQSVAALSAEPGMSPVIPNDPRLQPALSIDGPPSVRQQVYEQRNPDAGGGIVSDFFYAASGETVEERDARKKAEADADTAAAAAETETAAAPPQATTNQGLSFGLPSIDTGSVDTGTLDVGAGSPKLAFGSLQPGSAATTSAGTRTSGSSGGSGGGGGAGSVDSQIIEMLKEREKRAENDKWLALAQAGMALMSSTQPTLGGALGEAGAEGLKAFRASRDEYDSAKMDLLKTQQAMAKARASGASARDYNNPTAIGGAIDRFSKMQEDLLGKETKAVTDPYGETSYETVYRSYSDLSPESQKLYDSYSANIARLTQQYGQFFPADMTQ